jgi:superfamily I DNA/RNA helicase/Zn-dependent peptidase ImmA (M78 family)
VDAVELARQEAARLHVAAVAQGVDSWSPLAIVAAAAQASDIEEITGLKPGSALLSGARAKFDPQSRSILHEDTGDAFLTAFLIAHELGHARLGDARLPDQTCEIDPARSSEAAPDGEARVADYSRKSRREVQMDLFARELILPRSVARERHLAGMTASAIAERLGAPYAAIAQQLLDALLLPVVTPTDDDGDDYPLNDRQGEAARHEAPAFLLEAGPGTGKTKTLVGRVCDLVERRQVDPRRIVVLTFSNKAAGELSERIARRAPEAAAAMWIGTFHAYGLDLVRKFHGALGFGREPGLLDKSEAIALMLDRVPGLALNHYRDLLDPTDKLRDLLSGISRAQDEVVLADAYAALVDTMVRKGTADIELVNQLREVARVYRSYTDVKMALNRVDFGDLIALPTHLLETRPDIAAQRCSDIDHILVDEYQDVNRASVRLLKAMRSQGPHLWCVGDVRQSIYRFRGASSFNLARFDKSDDGGDFADAERGQLKVNYRSRAEIVTAYSAFAKDMPVTGATSIELEAHRGESGHPVAFRHVAGTKPKEIDGIADAITAMRDSNFAYRDQAVLCSGNDRLAEIGAGLEARNIPVLYLGSLFERPEVKDLLTWLSLLIDRRAMGLARVQSAAGYTFPLEDVAVISDALSVSEAAPLAWLTDHPPLSEEGGAVVSRYAALFAGLGPTAPPWETLARLLLDRSRIAADIASADAVPSRARGIALWQFMNYVRAQPQQRKDAISALLDRIRHLVRLSDDRDLRHLPQAASGIDAVRLMTMHGSKGLEFPVVHLPGLTKGTLPRGAQPPACPPPDGMVEGASEQGREVTDREHKEEQQCLFYVALSRAKDRLLLYSPNRDAGGKKRNPSDFVDRLGTAVTRTVVTANDYGIDLAERPVTIAYLGPPAFRQHELSLFERCPRRFFYTHILKLGGRRTSTAYEDMHEVVRAAMRELLGHAGAIDAATVAAVTERHWAESTLAAAASGSAYRPLADELIARFVTMRADGPASAGETLSFAVAGAAVRVDYDYGLAAGAGGAVLRQVQTGHRRKTVMAGATIMAPLLAALAAAPRREAELVFLADGISERLALADDDVTKRRTALEKIVIDILAGRFATKASVRTCPKCPAFFTCGAVPAGAMQKNFG